MGMGDECGAVWAVAWRCAALSLLEWEAVPGWVTAAVASAPLEMRGCGRESVALGGVLGPSAAPLEMLPEVVA